MALPEKVTIGGVEYSTKDPAIQALLNEARTEEKDKLYANIATLQASIKVLTDKETAGVELTKKQEADLKDLREALGAAKEELKTVKASKEAEEEDGDDERDKKKGKKDTDIVAQISKLMEAREKALEEKFEGMLSKVSGKLTQSQVDAYREKQLEQYKDVLIADFIPETLTTVEAVNEAVKAGIEKSKKYIRKEYEVSAGKKENLTLAEIEERVASDKKAADEKRSPTYVPNPAGGGAPPRPEGGGADVTGNELLSKVAEMSDAEYEKHREQILKQAKTLGYAGVTE